MTRKNNRTRFAIFIALVFLCVGTAHADWLKQIAGWLNLSLTTAVMKAPGNAPQAGDIFIAGLDGGPPRALTKGGGFISPVFSADDGGLLALRGDEVVSVPLSGGELKTPHRVANAVKLLGVNREVENKLLLLLRTAKGGTELGEMDLNSGQVKRLPHDPGDNTQRRMLSQLSGDDREYGDGTSIYLRTESKVRLGGHQIEWTDIYIKHGGQAPINVSRCEGMNCSQPALSRDGRHVVFIKANNES